MRAAEFDRALVGVMPVLSGYAMKLARNTVAAEDLVQQTVLKAMLCHEQFSLGTNIGAWACMIMRNEFYTQMRKRWREIEDVGGAIASARTVPPDQEDACDLTIVSGRIGALAPGLRDAINLVGMEQAPYSEAAEVLNVPEGTVKSRVCRARRALRRVLEDVPA